MIKPSLSYSRQTLKSYSGYDSVETKVYEPSTLEELQELVRLFYSTSTQFSISGACFSFDNHCLNENFVISCKNINYIQLNLAQNRISVGAGTSWEKILETLVPLGYGVYVTPTAGRITVGGSLSCDSYSRFTPGIGRESRWVRSLLVMTANGEVIRCDANTHSDLYYGIIGGLGMVAIICEVEFEVFYVGKNPSICTVGCILDGMQLEYAKANINLPEHEGEPFPGSGLVIYDYKGEYRTVITKHYWQDTKERKTNLVHQRRDIRRIIGGVMLRAFPGLVDFLWDIARKDAAKQPRQQIMYIEEPENMKFFMDAEWNSKRIAAKLGISAKVLQQSFIIPCTDEEESTLGIGQFVSYCLRELKKQGIKPTMMDLGFLPKGDRNVFSSKPFQSAYLLSIAIEGKAIPSYQTVYDLFADFSEVCHKEYQGRVHLTKNILCPQALLRTMYESELAQLLQLKAKYDPKGLLQTEFFKKHFGINALNNLGKE
jgi:hypothetical protein